MNHPQLLDFLREQGYSDFAELNGKLCGLQRFAFTTGLVVGMNEDCYERRYCYEHQADAKEALAQWDGKDHPGGPWIKCKGLGIDLLNPALGEDDATRRVSPAPRRSP